MTGYRDEFQTIDDPKTPKILKPMTILHDKLVKGYRDERDLRVDKLIRNMQKSISKQVCTLVDYEDEVNASNMVLVKCLNHIRKMIDSEQLPQGLHNHTIDFLLEQTNELSKYNKFKNNERKSK